MMSIVNEFIEYVATIKKPIDSSFYNLRNLSIVLKKFKFLSYFAISFARDDCIPIKTIMRFLIISKKYAANDLLSIFFTKR